MALLPGTKVKMKSHDELYPQYGHIAKELADRIFTLNSTGYLEHHNGGSGRAYSAGNTSWILWSDLFDVIPTTVEMEDILSEI